MSDKWDTVRATIDPAVWLGQAQPAQVASANAPTHGTDWLGAAAALLVAVLCGIIVWHAGGQALDATRQPYPVERAVPAALDTTVNVPDAIAGGGWRVISYEGGAAQVKSYASRNDAARAWALARYLNGYAALCAPGEACQAESVVKANAITRKGKP